MNPPPKSTFVTPSPRQRLKPPPVSSPTRPAIGGNNAQTPIAQPYGLRLTHWIIAALGVALVLFVVIRICVVSIIGRSAAAEAQSAAALLHLPDEVASILKIVAVMLVLDAAVPVLWPFALSMVGKRVRWKKQLVGRIAAIGAFFCLRPALTALTGLAVDAQPSTVFEIDPEKSKLFDPVDGTPLAGYVEDSGIHFYNRIKGHRPSDDREILPVTASVVSRWKSEKLTEIERRQSAAEELRERAAHEAVEQKKQEERIEAEHRRQSQIEQSFKNLQAARTETEDQRKRLEEMQDAINRANAARKQELERAEAEQERKAAEAAKQQETKDEILQKQVAELQLQLEAKRQSVSRSEEAVQRPPLTSRQTSEPPVIELRTLQQAVSLPPEQHRLLPATWLHLGTRGRPCTVWSDLPFEIFPNNPSLAHRCVRAGERLNFPVLNGVGPTTLHALPLCRGVGTLYVRYNAQ